MLNLECYDAHFVLRWVFLEIRVVEMRVAVIYRIRIGSLWERVAHHMEHRSAGICKLNIKVLTGREEGSYHEKKLSKPYDLRCPL